MCYAFTPVLNPRGGLVWLPKIVLEDYMARGLVKQRSDGFHYATDDVKVFYWIEDQVDTAVMRWDLVPRHFLNAENLPVSAMLKRKNSRAKGSNGFTSFNARLETLATLPSFRNPWNEGLRCAMPASAFRERPNMEGAPDEFKGRRQFNIELEGDYYLAGIWDTWRNKAGEELKSCTVITTDSAGNEKLRGIWHERCPIILTEAQVEEWLDPKTRPDRAMRMCRLFPADAMRIVEVPKPVKTGVKSNPEHPDEEQLGFVF